VAELKEINNKEKETKYENIIERDNVRLRDWRNKAETFMGGESTISGGSRKKNELMATTMKDTLKSNFERHLSAVGIGER